MKPDFASLTQKYSTWGDKLLQHTDVLHQIQVNRRFSPITVQLAPTEACDSDCPFCSVGNRPMGKIKYDEIAKGLQFFKALGAKSVELTGGGNPLLYRDGTYDINDVISWAALGCKLKVGIITNSENPSEWIRAKNIPLIDWIRVSLSKLDEGVRECEYDFSGFEGKVAVSYIMHAGSLPDILDRISDLVARWKCLKFVRIAADCTTEDSRTIEQRIGKDVAKLDTNGKFFIKDIGDNFHPFPGGCWVGMLRPYWTSTGIYICTSHVLKERKYLPEYRLCGPSEITEAWMEMNSKFSRGEAPYQIDVSKCWHCYYHNNNQLLSSVINELPDKDFA